MKRKDKNTKTNILLKQKNIRITTEDENNSEIIGVKNTRDITDEPENIDEIEEDEPVEEEIDEEVEEDKGDEEVEDEDDLNDNIEIDDEDKEIVDEKQEKIDDIECFYKYVNQEDDDKENDNEDIDEEYFEEDIKEYSDIVPNEDRITKPFLTKYERVRLIGDRVRQLSLGAKPMIKNVEQLSPNEIAELELKHNVIPLYIERPLPNGKKERWYIKELIH